MSEENESQSRQEAYEQAYYEAAKQANPENAQPISDSNKPVEQYHADPLVAAMADATAQRTEGSSYQQPWDSGTASYGQQSNGASQAYSQGYQQGYQQAYQDQQYYTQQSYTPYVRTKDHVAAGLLAIFLGIFGVHKFYLGYNNAGFIMLGVSILGSLFTFGIAGSVMGLVALVEGIIYLTKNQSAFDAIYVYGHKPWF